MNDYNQMWSKVKGLLGDLALAPARGMTAQPPQTPPSMGLLGRIHEVIDPVRALGGYGNMAAMALPPGKPPSSSGLKAQAKFLGEAQKELQAYHKRYPNPPPREVIEYVERDAARMGISPADLYDHILRTSVDPRIPRYSNIWKK